MSFICYLTGFLRKDSILWKADGICLIFSRKISDRKSFFWLRDRTMEIFFSIRIIRQLSGKFSASWHRVSDIRCQKYQLNCPKTHLSDHLLDTLEHMLVLAFAERNVRDLLFLTKRWDENLLDFFIARARSQERKIESISHLCSRRQALFPARHNFAYESLGLVRQWCFSIILFHTCSHF